MERGAQEETDESKNVVVGSFLASDRSLEEGLVESKKLKKIVNLEVLSQEESTEGTRVGVGDFDELYGQIFRVGSKNDFFHFFHKK